MQSVMSRNSNNYCMMGWYIQYKAQTNPKVKNKSYGQLAQVSVHLCVELLLLSQLTLVDT